MNMRIEETLEMMCILYVPQTMHRVQHNSRVMNFHKTLEICHEPDDLPNKDEVHFPNGIF